MGVVAAGAALVEGVVSVHAGLIDAIEARDVQRATTLLREHIVEAGERIVEVWLSDGAEAGTA